MMPAYELPALRCTCESYNRVSSTSDLDLWEQTSGSSSGIKKDNSRGIMCLIELQHFQITAELKGRTRYFFSQYLFSGAEVYVDAILLYFLYLLVPLSFKAAVQTKGS